MKPVYKRILLKLSGEGLMGDKGFGVDAKIAAALAAEIAEVRDLGVQICLVIGGGNFFRGAKNATEGMDRSVADQVGMMATLMNALVMKTAIERAGCPVEIFSGLVMPQVCETYSFREAVKSLAKGKVVIIAAVTVNPYFTTDSGAALRAAEMHCDVIMKATQVNGVYDSDPRFNPDAKRYETISFAEVEEKKLKVMDMTAITMAAENNIPIMVFAQKGKNSIVEAVCGLAECTIIK